jgi:uncharacterized cupredoxin-like copper-binding protein
MSGSSRRRALPAIAIVAALAACTGGSLPSGPLRPGTVAHPRDVNVIMRDYLFEPTPIRLVRGETVRFTIFDGGLLPHEFVLGGAAVQAAWASAEAVARPDLITVTPPPVSLPPDLAGLRVYLTSGHDASVLYRVPEGDLSLACHIPGHLEKGMVGRIEFVAPVPP